MFSSHLSMVFSFFASCELCVASSCLYCSWLRIPTLYASFATIFSEGVIWCNSCANIVRCVTVSGGDVRTSCTSLICESLKLSSFVISR